MATFSLLTLLVAVRFFLLTSAVPAPIPVPAVDSRAVTSSYWQANIARQGTAAFGASGYKVFRNVMDYGAVGDGMCISFSVYSLLLTWFRCNG